MVMTTFFRRASAITKAKNAHSSHCCCCCCFIAALRHIPTPATHKQIEHYFFLYCCCPPGTSAARCTRIKSNNRTTSTLLIVVLFVLRSLPGHTTPVAARLSSFFIVAKRLVLLSLDKISSATNKVSKVCVIRNSVAESTYL